MHLVRVSTCNLDQWALDWSGNMDRILESIRVAKSQGSRYRVGPELEVSGYGCEDHFLESDTIDHAWSSLSRILCMTVTHAEAYGDILIDLGMPLLHRGVRYNSRVFILNGRILFIRPKLYLADDGNYREGRWFTPYADSCSAGLEAFHLPPAVKAMLRVNAADLYASEDDFNPIPFGMGVLACSDATLACETCEELFTPTSPHIALSHDGVDIVSNGSGSHHQLRKLHTRMDLMRGATSRCGGVYLYSNQQGCDGGRLYYDGCAAVLVNGECVAQGAQFSVTDVEVVTATVDVDDVRSYRAAIASRGQQATRTPPLPRVHVAFALGVADPVLALASPPRPVSYLTPEAEIASGPACWLWDFLRRSGASGFFLPLSGGADSAATCTLVGIMCHLVMRAVESGDPRVIRDVKRVTRRDTLPASPAALANMIMHTCYMGTRHSSEDTRGRAAALAEQVGAYHLNSGIDDMCDAVMAVFMATFGSSTPGMRVPRFASAGGTRAEDLALQNVQARLRMVLAYLLAQLLPWVRSGCSASGAGFLLVLGSANVDEALRGYMTKYDCSSADINPIGGIAKGDLKRFLLYAADVFGYSSLKSIVGAPPTAELQPAVVDASGAVVHQLDEVDMGMTYEELGAFGRLRKQSRCGPLSMYLKLRREWTHLTPAVVAEKVKRFFVYYSINRHKCTTLTPAYHAESYSPDDNRFDLRPFLYPTDWAVPFQAIDADVAEYERATRATAASGASAAAHTSGSAV